MHPYLLVPLGSAIGAGVLAAAIAAREPDRHGNQLVGWLILAAGVWSLFQLLWNMAPDAELATAYIRWSSLGSLMMGPLVFHLLVTHGGDTLRFFRPIVPAAYAAAVFATLGSLVSARVIAGARPVPWGWEAEFGPGLLLIYLATAPLPVAAGVTWFVAHLRRPRSERGRLSAVGWAAAACFVVATATDVILPELGLLVPRLGAAGCVVWGAAAWWSIYRQREPRLAPQRIARAILETLPAGVALLRPDGRIRSSNDRLAQLAERPAEELSGREIQDLLTEADGWKELAEEQQRELVTASGKRIPVSVSSAPLEQANGGGTPGYVLTVRDLREVVSLRRRLVSSGRLVAVGQLAAGIAHEINNPIAYVRSNVRLLEEHWQRLAKELEHAPPGPLLRSALEEGPELVRETCDGIDRVAGIVRDVGSFSRGGVVAKESADLVELLDTAVRVAAPQLKRLSVRREHPALPRISCVPQELIQVFLNLLLNAAQACGEGGSIYLSTRLEDGEAVVEVDDDGPGIAPEIQGRVFEPFFTTKPVGEGTGLGLSISRQIVTKHGGRIELESQPPRGTVFRVHLPIAVGGPAGDGGSV